jgi:hypothetical protein
MIADLSGVELETSEYQELRNWQAVVEATATTLP